MTNLAAAPARATPPAQSWIIRSVLESDQPYIHRCYVRNYAETACKHRIQGIPKQCLDEGLEAMFRRIWRDSQGLVAIFTESPDLIMGWVLYELENKAVHYIHVRERMRRLGVGTAIFEHATQEWPHIAYTHDTPDWQKFVPWACPNSHYDPYRAAFSAKEMRG